MEILHFQTQLTELQAEGERQSEGERGRGGGARGEGEREEREKERGREREKERSFGALFSLYSTQGCLMTDYVLLQIYCFFQILKP